MLLLVPLVSLRGGGMDAILPAAGDAETANYLHTNGAEIVDAQGNRVHLTGINWFGMETGTYAPHGLWSRNWEEMLDQIVDLGFNTIRLPYSNEALRPGARPDGIDYDRNPDLEGLSPLEIMDKIVTGAGERDLKVILDRHRPTAEAQSNLWYTDEVSEEQWIADWRMLAARYKGNDTVIGVDLHNEPHGEATWGDGNRATDWRAAAERAGNAVLEVNPDLLIIVEGIEQHENDWYWWGGNLLGARKHPVRLNVPNRLVYSAHDYGPGVNEQGWFSEPNFPDNLEGIWRRHWAYLAEEDIAPVLLGEFGGRSVGKDAEGVWQRRLLEFLEQGGYSYTYWSLNPNSGDTGGVLLDDWTGVDAAKMQVLSRHQFRLLGNHEPEVVNLDAAPAGAPDAGDGEAVAAADPAPEEERPGPPTEPEEVVMGPPDGLRVEYRTGRPDATTNNPAPEFRIVNTSTAAASLDGVELRYWFTAEGNPGEQAVEVDWASVGGLEADVVADARAGQTHALRVRFTAEAGRLDPGQATELKVRIHKDDWSDYSQTDDYSFGEGDEYRAWPRTVLYAGGGRVWGEEPA